MFLYGCGVALINTTPFIHYTTNHPFGVLQKVLDNSTLSQNSQLFI